MHSALPESVITFVALLALALYVALRRERSAVHWLLLTLLSAMLAWTGGLSVFYYFESGEVASFALVIAFLGVFAVPPCWLLLAARHTHLRVFDQRPGWLISMLVLPAMSALAVVTNSGHRLFVRDFDRASLAGPIHEWAGPVFWVGIGFGILLLLLGAALYLNAAVRMYTSGQRIRALILGCTVTLPLLLGLVIGVSTRRDATPSSLGLMTLLLFAVNWRHRILETLPIARRDVIEHLPDGVMLTDRSGFVLDVNPAGEDVLNAPVDELRRRPLALLLGDLACESDAARVEEALGWLVENGTPVSLDFETGDESVLEINAACVRGGDGEAAGFYALLRDRTQERRYERLLRQSHRLESIASLSAGIAHEVNSPLAFVRSNLGHVQRISSLLADDLGAASQGKLEELEELAQVAEEGIDGVDRISRTIDRMRRFSRLQDDEVGDVDLNEVAIDAVRIARLRLAPDLSVKTDLAASLPTIRGSAEHLVQAVLTLLVNGQQALAGHGDGLLQIATRRTRDGAELLVSDNGPGISEAIQQRIFDPFYTTKSPGEGTGLGLAIAFGIVREHGGTLDLDSSPGAGSEFVMRLPASPDHS